MGFWIFMLIVNLLLPVTMIGFGRYFIRSAPKQINSVFGYRTAMSMKNKDTWQFAHSYCGKLWLRCGLVMLPLVVIAMACVLGGPTDTVGTVGAALCLIQLVPLAGSIIPTERALKRTFDKDGKRR